MKKIYFFLVALFAGALSTLGDTYTVVCTQMGGGITYTNTSYTNGQTIDAPANTTFTATAVSGYVAMASVIGNKVYADYYATNKQYIIKHSSSATNNPDYYLALSWNDTGLANGISVRADANERSKWVFSAGTAANSVKIANVGGVSGYGTRYLAAPPASGITQFGSTAANYTLERVSETEVVLHSGRYLTNTSGSNAVGGTTKDDANAHWRIAEPGQKTVNYTLTDTNGAVYRESVSIAEAASPTLGGCEGATLSNVSITETGGVVTYTATVAFPFPISSNNVVNWSYLGFEPSGIHCHVYTKANNTSVFGLNPNSTSPRMGVATNQAGDQDYFMWKFVPTFADGAFAFKIYNQAAAKYIKTAEPAANADAVAVSLVEAESEATPFTYAHTTVTGANGYGFWHSDGLHLLQVDGSGLNSEQTVRMLKKTAHAAHKGFNTDFDTPYDFEALTASLREATTGYDGLLGTGVGKYTATQAWTTAKTEAETFLAQNTTFWSGVQFTNHITTLNALSPTAVGQGFYRFKSAGGNRYLSAGKSGTTLKASAEADETTIMYFTGTQPGHKNFMAYHNGYYLSEHKVGAVSSDCQYYINAAPAACLKPVEGGDVVRGQYAINYWSNEHVVDLGNDAGTLESTTEANRRLGWLVESVAQLPLTVPTTGYTTFSCPMAVSLPEDWTAYTVSSTNATSVILEAHTGAIPAATGVIIEATGGATGSLTVESTAEAVTGNLLQPNWAAANHVATAGHYFLATVDGQTGFYRQAADGILPGHKAYLPAPATEAKAFLPFDLGTATGLDAVGELLSGKTEIYDLGGRRQTRLQKGVNIVNGKKIIVR